MYIYTSVFLGENKCIYVCMYVHNLCISLEHFGTKRAEGPGAIYVAKNDYCDFRRKRI